MKLKVAGPIVNNTAQLVFVILQISGCGVSRRHQLSYGRSWVLWGNRVGFASGKGSRGKYRYCFCGIVLCIDVRLNHLPLLKNLHFTVKQMLRSLGERERERERKGG